MDSRFPQKQNTSEKLKARQYGAAGFICLKLPTEIFEFLTETGLPIHAGYEITPNAPITFLSMPTIKKYPYLQHLYLQIGSLDVMGELAINLTFQSVYQIQIVNDNGYDMAILYYCDYLHGAD